MSRQKVRSVWVFSCAIGPVVASASAAPLGTSVTFQGQLKNGGAAVNDTCDMDFDLWDAESGGAMIGTIGLGDVAVSDGLFDVTLDFGAGVFVGDARWLEIAVQCSGDAEATTLLPRSPLAPVPFAVYASNAPVGHSLDADDGSPVDALYVNQFGQVGIGLTTPQFPLQVHHGAGTGTVPANSTAIYGSSASGYGVVGFSKGAARAGIWGENNATSGEARGVWGRSTFSTGIGVFAEGFSFSGANHALHAKTNSPDGFAGYFEGGKSYFEGDVGIGTTNPSEPLHVVGNICATGTIGACSDARFKKNIETVRGALDAMTRIRGVWFNWRREAFRDHKFSDGRQIGFIAQELERVIPEAVTTGRDGYRSVDYGRVVPLLTEAVKELHGTLQQKDERIEEMTARLERLESTIATLIADRKADAR